MIDLYLFAPACARTSPFSSQSPEWQDDLHSSTQHSIEADLLFVSDIHTQACVSCARAYELLSFIVFLGGCHLTICCPPCNEGPEFSHDHASLSETSQCAHSQELHCLLAEGKSTPHAADDCNGNAFTALEQSREQFLLIIAPIAYAAPMSRIYAELDQMNADVELIEEQCIGRVSSWLMMRLLHGSIDSEKLRGCFAGVS